MIIPEGRLLSGQIQRSISIHDATDEDSHSLHLPPLASPLAIQKGRSRASAHTPLGQSEFHESLGLIAQKKLVSELDKKILILSSFLFRLECYASPKLKECLSLFQSLSSCLDLMGDPMAKIGPIQRQIAEISYEVEEESRQCVDRYAVACLSTIAPTISKHVDKVPSFAAEMTFERRIAELVSNLVTTGLTNKMTVTGSSENECMIKCRYRNGRVQILTREIIGQGGMKTIWKVSILAGPTGRFGSLFAYAKPRADGEKFTRDQCLIFMSRELEIENFLRKSGVCNIVELVPEFRQKSVKRKMKGFVMEFFDKSLMPQG